MTHEEALARIPEWLQGRLDPSESDAVARHAGTCDACRETAETYRLLQAAFAESSQERHPDAEALVRLAMAGEGAEEGEAGRHAAGCPDCARLVATVREAEARLARTSAARPHRGRRAMLLRAAAALLAAGAIGHAGYLQWVRLPEARRRAAAAEARLEASGRSGLLRLPLVAGVRRAEGETPLRIALAEGEGTLLLAVAPDLPPTAAPGSAYVFELRDARGHVLWSTTADRAEIARGIEASGALALMIPLAPEFSGRTELILRPAGESAARPLLAAPLEIVRSPGS